MQYNVSITSIGNAHNANSVNVAIGNADNVDNTGSL